MTKRVSNIVSNQAIGEENNAVGGTVDIHECTRSCSTLLGLSCHPVDSRIIAMILDPLDGG
jgi:hypothetical protein